jgi:hypothetical protein
MTDTEVKMRAVMIAASAYGPIGFAWAAWFYQMQLLRGV